MRRDSRAAPAGLRHGLTVSAPATSVLTRLEELVGSARVVSDAATLAGYEIDGLRPAAAVSPGSAAEVAEVVRFAAAERLALIAAGGRTKLGIGAPPRRYDLALDLTRLNRVLAYDPGDLTLGVEPGIRFSELTAVLAEKKQFLPLAPPFADRATLGGIVSSHSSTPLRHAYGTPRDYVLGMEFVTGEGVASKSGGRVVKNVTGYDLHKLLIGAFGTLAVITRINFRTFPLPPAQTTFVAFFPGAEQALEFCRAIAESPLQPRLVEVVEPQAARILSSGAAETGGPRLPAGLWSVAVAAAGSPGVVARHAKELLRIAQHLRAAGFVELTEPESSVLLGRICEFPKHLLEQSPAATIFRISVLPTGMRSLLERAREIAERNQLSWAGLVRASGIVFVALLPAESGSAALPRLARAATALMQSSVSPEIGGRPMIEWCPTALKREVSVWGPPRDDLVLMQRLKKVFDPHGILCPGRFVGGV